MVTTVRTVGTSRGDAVFGCQLATAGPGVGKLLTGGPQWVLKCDRSTRAIEDGKRVWVTHFIGEKKICSEYVETMLL